MERLEEVKEWAPVLIPTLCRYSLLQQSLESLNNCIGASYTDVYIALDYPIKESHKEGWLKIKEYLANTSFNFKKFVVYERDSNYGIGDGVDKEGNLSRLCKDVLPNYKTYILSEDDNVFSKNFLLYMNKGLQRFKDDDSVIAICGYRYFYNHVFDKNNFFRNQQDYNAWGVATWVDKQAAIDNIDYTYFRSKLWNFRALYRVWKAGPIFFSIFLDYTHKKNFKKADYFYGLYMILEDKYQIMPRISKVRNIGWNAGGEHCNNYPSDIVSKHLHQPIDQADSFEFEGTGFEYLEENRIIMRDEDYNRKFALSRFRNLCILIRLQLGVLLNF